MPARPNLIVTSPGSHLARTQTALEFAKRLLRTTGRLAREDVAVMRDAGFSEHEIACIVAAVMGRCRNG